METVIQKQNIIAVTAAPSGSGDTHTLLYTIPNTTQEEGSKTPSPSFGSLHATTIPQPLIEDFRPAEKNPWLFPTYANATQIDTHVIISTGSGTSLASSVWSQLVKPLLECNGFIEGDHYALHFTTSETSISELTENVVLPHANKGLATSILLLSGDGGIVDIVNTLLSAEITKSYKKPTITLSPLGTGNAMANSSGITGDGKSN